MLLRRSRNRLWPLVAAGVIMLPTLGWWWLNLDPVIDQPALEPLPSPNAFDFYVAAGEMLVDSEGIEYALTGGAPERGAERTAEQLQDALRANAPALATFRAGLRHAYAHPPVTSFDTVLPHFSRSRSLARVIALESRTLRENGDPVAALDSAIDGLEFGTQVGSDGPLIGLLVGIACEALARPQAWAAAELVDGPTAAAAARRLEAIEMRRAPFADVVEVEWRWLRHGVMEFFEQPDWRWNFHDFIGDGEAKRPSFAFLLVNERRSMRLIDEYYSRELVASRLPYPRAIDPANAPSLDAYTRRDPVTAALLPAFNKSREKIELSAARARLLYTSLALRAYEAEHGRPAASLEELVPEYLSAVPLDPFTESQPLQYLGGKLYSVGLDLVDDGGRPVAQKPGSAQFSETEARGDLVAGVTRG